MAIFTQQSHCISYGLWVLFGPLFLCFSFAISLPFLHFSNFPSCYLNRDFLFEYSVELASHFNIKPGKRRSFWLKSDTVPLGKHQHEIWWEGKCVSSNCTSTLTSNIYNILNHNYVINYSFLYKDRCPYAPLFVCLVFPALRLFVL